MQILDHVREDIETDQIECAEGCGLRTADSRPRDLVYLLNRITIFEHRAHGNERAERADAIRDEVRTILRYDYAFA